MAVLLLLPGWLQGYRLAQGRYQAMAPEPDGALFSRVLNMFLTWNEAGLRLIDARTGEVVLTRSEEREAFEAALKEAQGQLAQESRERQALEEEVARLRLELERNRHP